MKVLVAGGMGYIGSHTCVELLEKGYEVVIVDNLCNSSPEAAKRVAAITGKTPLFYELDVRDEKGLSAVFEKERPDCVIHFAGLKAVGESVEKPELYYDRGARSSSSPPRPRYTPRTMRCPSQRTPRPEGAPTPTAGQSTLGSASSPTSPRQIRSGAWCCCATLTRWAPTKAD